MQSEKNYSTMPLEELRAEEHKMKGQKTMTALIIGLLVGVAVYAATNKKFLLPVGLILIALAIGSGYSKKLKSLQAEIKRRENLPGA